jgi:cytoskeletal protein RodZ
MAGVLVVGVGGGLTWLLLQSNPPSPSTSTASLPAPSNRPLSTEPTEPVAPEPAAAPDLNQAAADAAQVAAARSTVEQLYNDLSVGNIAAARRRFGGEAADQFDPTFFKQFQRVSADKLQVMSRDGNLITLEGTVTFVYPDGTSQSESRSFRVDTDSDPALITASSFGEVLRSRQ